LELEANADSSSFEVLTAADILRAKSTEQLKQVVREKREERENPEEVPAPPPFEPEECRTVTTAEAFSAPWNPEGTKLATYVHENTAQIWTAGTTLEYQNKAPMTSCSLVHGQKTSSQDSVIVTQLVWAPDGRHITTGCSDGTICTWSCEGASQGPCSARPEWAQSQSATAMIVLTCHKWPMHLGLCRRVEADVQGAHGSDLALESLKRWPDAAGLIC
jgi:WD40 repeat protein